MFGKLAFRHAACLCLFAISSQLTGFSEKCKYRSLISNWNASYSSTPVSGSHTGSDKQGSLVISNEFSFQVMLETKPSRP